MDIHDWVEPPSTEKMKPTEVKKSHDDQFFKKISFQKIFGFRPVQFFPFHHPFCFLNLFGEKNFKSKKKHFLHHFFDRSFLGLFGNCVKDLSLEEQRNY